MLKLSLPSENSLLRHLGKCLKPITLTLYSEALESLMTSCALKLSDSHMSDQEKLLVCISFIGYYWMRHEVDRIRQSVVRLTLGAIAENEEQERLTEFQAVKSSPNYKQLRSVAGQRNGIKKTFIYHYSEDEKCKLGAGSYGEVYRCYFQEVITNRVHKFAMKIILVPSSTSQVKKIEDIVATTRQEIKCLLKCRHNPNIIKIEDVIGDIKNNRIFIILQLCNNGDLPSYFEKLRRDGRLKTEEDVLFYFKQLLNGFRDLDKNNIVHRDIKPENILAHNSTLKIADFGLSQQFFQKNIVLHQNVIKGTLLTSSPQIIFKEQYTSKCDIYSLGMTLYWMMFQRFPFSKNLDHFDSNQLANQLSNIAFDGPVKISSELAQLIKHMVAYKESQRIDWQDLFNHPLFKGIKDGYQMTIRNSIGRNLPGESESLMLQTNIPSEFYYYIGDNSVFDLNVLLEGSDNKEKTQCFMKVFMEGVNFKFKVDFMKMLLREVSQLHHSEIIKNKPHFAIIKDLLRLGIDNYVLYLNCAFKSELQGLNPLGVIDIKILNEINNSKFFHFYVEKYIIEIEGYQSSSRKDRLSKGERESLEKNCKMYCILDHFHLFFAKDYEWPPYLVKEFLEQMKKCIVELIYFVKQEVFLYADRERTLSEPNLLRYKQLILLIHHLNMFIIQDRIFPHRYDPDVDYDTERFCRNEKFEDRASFTMLAKQVNEIICRFEN